MAATTVTISEVVAEVQKYMGQLKKERKIAHALRRLNRIPMTVEVLEETLVDEEVRKSFSNHPEHGHLARAMVEKWMARVTEDTASTESRKRPAEDTITDASGDEITANSGLSFEDALKACAAPPPAKKPKLALPATAAAASVSVPTSPAAESVKPDSDELFEIKRKHTQSRVYSGKVKATDVASPSLPTISSLLQKPSTASYQEVEPVLQRCSVEQLERIELLNPQWMRQTELIWRKMVQRDFPGVTARDTFSWRLSYQLQIQQRENRLAAITARINGSNVVQPKSVVPLIPVKPKKVRAAPSSDRAPLAPINGSRTLRTNAPAKTRPAPLMAKAIKMMNNRHRR